MNTIVVKIKGTAPMLMHSDRLTDPLSDVAKAHKKLTSDRNLKKTDEGQLMIAKSEFLASLYLDDTGVICLPSLNIRKSLIEGARLFKGGKQIERGVIFPEMTFKLNYSGPKDPEKLWENKAYVDGRSVVVGRAKIIRYRPIFPEWNSEVETMFNPDLINEEDLLHYWEHAGMCAGLGDFRPLFGRYEVEVIQ
ncbi:MAG TPA: hypothetical protein VMW20_07305 [Candidatus Nanoarchaeia archaeon]|nr:hypothetical protein [Candidatus Nanoarchaeia archaeon]